ncbi:MAG: alanine racemase [Ignavibacteria bacterium]|nr:alanine racemase [Ignavibacteria bacterium]
MRPTIAQINLANLKANYLAIRKKTKTKVLAVVKADAYGHGYEEVVSALNSLSEKPEYYGVALAEEGIAVRKLKVKQPILIFEPPSKYNVDAIIKYDLIPTIFSSEHIKLIEEKLESRTGKAKSNSAKKIKVHVKIDTGMGRVGIKHQEAVRFIEQVSLNNKFILDGVYSHFATSDEKDKTFAELQLKRFNQILTELKKKNISIGITHIANSGAILSMPGAYLDMVRPGISLYGYPPSNEITSPIKLRPVMSIISEVTSCRWYEKGESVSYGRKFILKKRSQIISIPIGYADGLNRNLSNKMFCIIKDKRFSQVGSVTMDRIMFDIGKANIKIGDKVILLGESKHHKIYAWDWSKALNTIPYEITCNISKRVPRVYIS